MIKIKELKKGLKELLNEANELFSVDPREGFKTFQKARDIYNFVYETSNGSKRKNKIDEEIKMMYDSVGNNYANSDQPILSQPIA